MKTKKILCCLLVLFTLFILDTFSSAYDYNDNDIIINYLPGDVDSNGKITSADARLCLRASAMLETLTEEQHKAADLDRTGKIDSSNARSILRAAAKLETLSATINIQDGQQIVAGPYSRPNGTYNWTCKSDSINTTIVNSYDEDSSDGGVKLFDQLFTITTDETKSFTVTIQAESPWTGEIDYSVNLNIVVLI